MSFWTLLAVSAPVLALMAAGWAVRRLGWLSAEADASLLRLVVNLLYPCLVFGSVMGNAAASAPRNLATAPLAGAASLAVGYAVSWGIGRLSGVRAGPERRTFTFITGIHNYGYVAIPVAQQLYPAALGVLFVYSLGVEVMIWTVGIAIVSGASGGGLWRRLGNPTLVAILLGVGLDLAGLGPRFPAPVLTGVRMLGSCAVPLALLLIGATIADELRGDAAPTAGGEGAVHERWHGWWVIGLAHLLRLGVLPLLVLLVARALPLSVELRQVLVVQAAMPAAVLPVALTKHHAGDIRTAVRIAVGTNALAVLTIPLWIRAGMALVAP